MRETLREFCDRTEREAWWGLSTAYRSGAKAALTGAKSNYTWRQDFQGAWERGHTAMVAFIEGGGEIQLGETTQVFGRGPDGRPIEVHPPAPKRAYNRRGYGTH